MENNSASKVVFLDTTLRDGNKLPFVVMNLRDRVEIAHKLEELGVDIIDAGYPFASDRDKEAIYSISREIEEPYVSALSRAIVKDIDFTINVLSNTKKPYLHIFMPISDQFITEVLKKDRLAVLKMIEDSIGRAKKAGVKVQFSFCEFSQANGEFLFDGVETACSVGVDTVSLADTNGVISPMDAGEIVGKLRTFLTHKGFNTRIGVHFHNDLGVATANTLLSIENGARHVEVTVGGLGARSGNTPLEEVALGIDVFGEKLGVHHSLNMHKLDQLAILVSHLTGISPHPNKPVIGRCAFKEPEGSRSRDSLSEELKAILCDSYIGRESDRVFSEVVLSKGKFVEELKALGFGLEGVDIEKLHTKYLYYMEKRNYIKLSELKLIIDDIRVESLQTYILESFGVMTGSKTTPVGVVELYHGESKIVQSSSGSGPIDALYKAVDRAVGLSPKLIMYTVDTVSEGKDASAEITVTVEIKGKRFHGHYGSTDVIEASLVAYLNAINRILSSGITNSEETFYVDGDTLWE